MIFLYGTVRHQTNAKRMYAAPLLPQAYAEQESRKIYFLLSCFYLDALQYDRLYLSSLMMRFVQPSSLLLRRQAFAEKFVFAFLIYICVFTYAWTAFGFLSIRLFYMCAHFFVEAHGKGKAPAMHRDSCVSSLYLLHVILSVCLSRQAYGVCFLADVQRDCPVGAET